MLGSTAGQYPGKGGGLLPHYRLSSARAWGQGRECLHAGPPFSSSQALSLPSLLVGEVPPANPPLNMVHTRLPPLDPDLPAFPGELFRGEKHSGIAASGLAGGQAVQPPAFCLFKPAPHEAVPSLLPMSGKRGLGLHTPSRPARNLMPKCLAGPRPSPTTSRPWPEREPRISRGREKAPANPRPSSPL